MCVIYMSISGRCAHNINSGIAMDEMGFFVSKNLHHNAIKNIFYAPMSFFDTTVNGLFSFLKRWTEHCGSPPVVF